MKAAAIGLAAVVAMPLVIGAAVEATVNAVVSSNQSQPSVTAVDDIPANYLALYQQAARVCPGLDWTVLAGIGRIETDHGRDNAASVHSGENSAGAGGPMQFLQPTFRDVVNQHPLPPGGATPPSRYNPHDAIFAAAYYLCDNGARNNTNLRNAIYQYNHATWYVDDVLAQAKKYAATTTTSGPSDCAAASITNQQTNDTALIAVQFACQQLGKPYVWGGNGNPGFDCSGLTHAAYAAAGLAIPRTAQTQYNAGPLLPPGTPAQPGDLIFFGTPNHIHHVGIALGNGTLMINAPTFGQPVRTDDYQKFPDFAGLSRPIKGD